MSQPQTRIVPATCVSPREPVPSDSLTKERASVIAVVNLGIKSIRCIAFGYAGEVRAQSSAAIHTQVSNEAVEQSPHEWDRLMHQVVGDVVAQLGAAASAIDLVTVTTSASCLVVMDEDGRVLRDSILVSDTRSAEQLPLLRNTEGFAEAQAETGLRPSPDLMIPKMMWLAKHEPETVHRAGAYLGADAYLVWRLTGELVTDPSNALKFHYLLDERRYPEGLLDTLGFDAGLLPRVELQGMSVGEIRPEIAAATGLRRGCQVVLATYDALAAVTGSGAFEVGEAADVSGTLSSFRAVSDARVEDPEGRFYVSPYVDGTWLVGGSNNLGGGMVEWLRQLFFANVPDPYAEIEAEAASRTACPGGLIFLPYLLGERAPIWNPNARGVFFGLNRAHRRPDMVRSVLESIGFSVRDIKETMGDCGVPIHSVTASGGLARLDVANQIKADILGLPVRRPANFETTSIGAALIALVGAGVFPDLRSGAARFCTIDREYDPDETNHTLYTEYFDLYRDVYASLIPAFERRKELLDRLRSLGVDELILTENL